MAAEPQKLAGQHHAAQRREELPAFEAGAGQFEGERSQCVEAEVDHRLAGGRHCFQPLLTDAVRGDQEPLLAKQMRAARAGQRFGQTIERAFAWR